MATTAHAPEVIEIQDDSDESSTSMGLPLNFLDFETEIWGDELPMEFDGALSPPAFQRRPVNPTLDFERIAMDPSFSITEPHIGTSAPTEQLPGELGGSVPSLTTIAFPTLPAPESCLKEIIEVFPDISHDHVLQLYEAEVQSQRLGDMAASVVQNLIEKILEKGRYPKQKDHLNELKRKRLHDSDEEELAEFKNAGPEDSWTKAGPYYNISKQVLSDDFINVPFQFIDRKFKESGQFFKTYQILESAEREWEATGNHPYQRLKRPRKKTFLVTPAALSDYIDSMAPYSFGLSALKREITVARKQRKKEDDKRQVQKDQDAADKAKEKLYIDHGDVLTCGICLDEAIPTYKIVQCDNAHFCCFECLRSYAKDRIGMQEWELKCCDMDGCDASFRRSQRAMALDAKTMETLDRLQQQAEIKQAGMEGLAHCPFCHFAAICPPIKVDWEFKCDNPECGKVSCRRCNRDTHAPKSCKEAKADQGIDERHAIEEARTAALIKKCPGCGRGIIKDGGCNKVRCQCGRTICDVCGQDVSMAAYNHFSQGEGLLSRLGGKCPLYDDSVGRLEKGVQAAEAKAMKKIREENPDISEEDLKIKFKKEVQGGNLSPSGRLPAIARIGGMMGRAPLPPGFPGGYGPPVYAPGLQPYVLPGYGANMAPQPRLPYYPPGDRYGHPMMAPPMQFPYPAPPHAPALPPELMGNFGLRRRHAPDAHLRVPGAFPQDDVYGGHR